MNFWIISKISAVKTKKKIEFSKREREMKKNNNVGLHPPRASLVEESWGGGWGWACWDPSKCTAGVGCKGFQDTPGLQA